MVIIVILFVIEIVTVLVAFLYADKVICVQNLSLYKQVVLEPLWEKLRCL